jgi:uncharacterized protein YdeI (BOF family)
MDKNFLIILCISILFASCGGSSKNDKSQTQQTRYEKPNKKQVMTMPLREALLRYGETTESYMGVRDDEFVFRGGEPEFRIELNNFYTPEQYENQTIIIKEITWQINARKKITVWYEKQNDTLYIPKHYCVYSNDMLF